MTLLPTIRDPLPQTSHCFIIRSIVITFMSVIQIFGIIVLIFSVVIHEVTHGLVALKLGDETAKNAGRLTLNPIPHLDLFGSIIVPLILAFTSPFIIGWAKPVPYNPMMLHKDYKYGPLKVALAGPGSNLAIAVIFSGLIRIGATTFLTPILVQLFSFVVFLNVLLAVFNLIPVPPLDGSKILITFLPRHHAIALERIGMFGIFIVFALLMLFGGLVFGSTFYISSILMGSEGANALISFLGL